MTISEAKDKVLSLRGKDVRVIVNKGRKKIEKYDCRVQEVFPGVFTLSLNGSCPVTTLSYAYSDVVCGNVKFRQIGVLPGAAEQFVCDTPDMYFHYFISSQVLLEHSPFFIDRKAKTIVLANGAAGTPQLSHFHTLNIYQDEEHLVRTLLQLQHSAHAHGKSLPADMPAAQSQDTDMLRITFT